MVIRKPEDVPRGRSGPARGLLPHEQTVWLRSLGWYDTGSRTPWCWHHPTLPAIYRLKDAYRIARHEQERGDH